mgnify:CR=1 FL=1
MANNILIIGPPASGKTYMLNMLQKNFPESRYIEGKYSFKFKYKAKATFIDELDYSQDNYEDLLDSDQLVVAVATDSRKIKKEVKKKFNLVLRLR